MRAMAENSDSARLSGVWVQADVDARVGDRRAAVGDHRDPRRAGPVERAQGGAAARAAAARARRRADRRHDELHGRVRRRHRASGSSSRSSTTTSSATRHRRRIITFWLFALILVVLLVRVAPAPTRAAHRGALVVGFGRRVGPRRDRHASDDGSGASASARSIALAAFLPLVVSARALVPARADVHLRGHRAVAHGAHRLGRTGVARPVRARRRRRDHRRAQLGDWNLVAAAARSPGVVTAVVAIIVGPPRAAHPRALPRGDARSASRCSCRSRCCRRRAGTRRSSAAQVCTGLPDPASTLVHAAELPRLGPQRRPATSRGSRSACCSSFAGRRAHLARPGHRAAAHRRARQREPVPPRWASRSCARSCSRSRSRGSWPASPACASRSRSSASSPSDFSPTESILVLSMVVIGGLGSVLGAVLGALYLVGLPGRARLDVDGAVPHERLRRPRVPALPARRPRASSRTASATASGAIERLVRRRIAPGLPARWANATASPQRQRPSGPSSAGAA